jgi:hypothetical protein
VRGFIPKQNRHPGSAESGTARPGAHKQVASPRIDRIRSLQRAIGNQAVWRLLQPDGHGAAQAGLRAAGGAYLLVQRAALKGHTTAEKVDDSIAAVIDKAVAESPTIARFVSAKGLKAEHGHLEVEAPAVFEERYRKYAKAVGATDKPEDVAGFTERKAGEVHLKFHTADVEAALHEAIHLNSSEVFQRSFGHPYNEGVTEYFAQKVLEEQKLKPGKAYPDQLKMAQGLVAALDENQVGSAYFTGSADAYKAVVKALGNALPSWRTLISSEDPKDWEKATAQVKTALSK